MNRGILRGISAPLLTAFASDGSVDYDRYAWLAAYVTGHGINTVFVGGTTGEFVNLTLEERRDLLVTARRSVSADAHIMFNVTAMNLRDLCKLLDWSAKYGADAVSITAPYYHKYDDQALTGYFSRVAALAEGQLLYLYNIPGMAGNAIAPRVLREVADRCPNLAGIKDSSMDFMTLLEYQCAISDPDFELITGNDAQILPALQSGAAGGLIAMASVFPALCRQIWDLYQAGDMKGARAAQQTVLRLRDIARTIMPVMAHKEMLRLLGYPMGPARFPMRDLTAEERDQVRDGLQQLQLLP